MLRTPPVYFERIQNKSREQWSVLEKDPDLAAPWRLLFEQIQSPQHVLSELLQNADDACATEARVDIKGNQFIFSHNGVDFTESSLESICKFGCSNKKTLRTIGFRGIGFKSIFSIGSTVSINTPTLSLKFDESRFSYPIWTEPSAEYSDSTVISLIFKSEVANNMINTSISGWSKDPLPLLFFNNLRKLTANGEIIDWVSLGIGPTPGSEWFALNGDENNSFLLIRSSQESFPPDAITEIQKTRTLMPDKDDSFPPCALDIVLDAPGKLYVVLPTEVETRLPYAINAPFLQDPSRTKIVDPEMSATNRWLLERAGGLAAWTMMEWVGNKNLPIEDRARAYDLMPDGERSDRQLSATCEAIIEQTFKKQIDNRKCILTYKEELVDASKSIVIDKQLTQIWPEAILLKMFKSDKNAICNHVSSKGINRLKYIFGISHWSKKLIEINIHKYGFVKPENYDNIITLWALVANDLITYSWMPEKRSARIFPVKTSEYLMSAEELLVIRNDQFEIKDELSDLLHNNVNLLDPDFMNYVNQFIEKSRTIQNSQIQSKIKSVESILAQYGLNSGSGTDKIARVLSGNYFANNNLTKTQYLNIARLFAALELRVQPGFQYVTRDGKSKDFNYGLLYDSDKTLEEFVPFRVTKLILIDNMYIDEMPRDEMGGWNKWVNSEKSGVASFPLPSSVEKLFEGESDICNELLRRGCTEEPSLRKYRTNQYIIKDYDYGDDYWRRWAELERNDEAVWVEIVRRIISLPTSLMEKCSVAKASQVATSGNTSPIISKTLIPAWIIKLRQKKCLLDANGIPQYPGELYRRTDSTDALRDVENFIAFQYDTEPNRPLLDLLGVQSRPLDFNSIMRRLKSLTSADEPPLTEVEKWYRRLDNFACHCSTKILDSLIHTFRTEKLILAESGVWVTSGDVFRTADENDVPGANVVLRSVNTLSLWSKLGVEDRPTIDSAISWLKTLPEATPLLSDELRRVRALIRRHPVRIWRECEHWLNLSGEWTPASALHYYSLTHQSSQETHLFDWVKKQTMEVWELLAEDLVSMLGNSLPPLSPSLENRMLSGGQFAGTEEKLGWLNELGEALFRIVLDEPGEMKRVRELGNELRLTVGCAVPRIESTPYLDGKPAGPARSLDVLWQDRTLFTNMKYSGAKLAHLIPKQLSLYFPGQDIKDALIYAYGRSANEVREYCDEVFELGAPGSGIDAHGAEDHLPSASEPESDRPRQSQEQESHPESELDEPAIPTHHGEQIRERDASAPANDGERVIRKKNSAAKDQHHLFERFALMNGFSFDVDGNFRHPDGRWLSRSATFKKIWEMYQPNGKLRHRYLAEEIRLDLNPMEIEADIWALLEKEPERMSIILLDREDQPLEKTGAEIIEMQESGILKLFPALYRILLVQER